MLYQTDVEGLDRDSIILLGQIRTIDKQRLKNHMGTMPDVNRANPLRGGCNSDR
jgi:mRNA-degrading endonuclease toxin of MazEF toxin-antitoxin module